MNPIVFAMRRPLTTLMLVVALSGGGVFGLYKMRVDIPPLNTTKIYASLDYAGVNAKHVKEWAVSKYEANFGKHEEKEKGSEEGGEPEHAGHKVVVTTPIAKDVTITQQYVCQIHSQRHIEVCAFEGGYLDEILVREGQKVKKGDLMFQIRQTLFKAKLDAEVAEAQVAEMKFKNTEKLFQQKVVSQQDVAIHKAEYARAQAKADLARAELDFTHVVAPFDGIVDRLKEREGSLIKDGDMLTTLSDNSVMWVYFNVPERRYLEYMAEMGQNKDSAQIELRLANLNKFTYTGKIGAIEAKFNNETGNIPFRADFPNPDGLLRHGQTGTIVISRNLSNAIVIPQRATYETLAKRYVYVVDKNSVVHQREIFIQYELEDIFVIEKGLEVGENIILEGIRQVHDGEKVEFESRNPEEVLRDPKNHAE